MIFARHAATAALAAFGIASFVQPSRGEQVLVASLVDDIVYADLVGDGDCTDGCRREEHAVAHVSGTPQTRSCELETVTPFDSADVEPGLLRASIYCEDATGALIEQGNGPCRFEICVDFSWADGEGDEEGKLTYDVLIIRDGKPRAPHTVYVDLSVAVDPTSNGNVDSCSKNGTCALQECTGTESYTAVIAMTDKYGDGWVGGVDGSYNLWTLTDLGTNTVQTRGTLADNHESATIMECLADGEYIFNTTANAAFAEDMDWNICNTYGVGGEGLKFTVADGKCDDSEATKIDRATAEESEDAESSYCVLPARQGDDDYRTSTCTALSSGMKIDGVGLYYDDRCNSAQLSGCGARSIDACRLCFVDRDQWKLSFPYDRVPDWEDCPCCVATTLGVDCATGGGSGDDNQGVIIGVSVGIAGVIAIACCLSCAFGTTILRCFRRMKKQKTAEMALDLDDGAAAFPDSPTGGGNGTIRGTNLTNGARGRGNSGHFPIPRFDSIRGRFDSGIFASNAGGASSAGAGAVHASGEMDKIRAEEGAMPTTAQSTPSRSSAHGGRGSPNAPRSTVLDDRLVAQGFTTSDVGRPLSGVPGAARKRNGGASGWGLAMSGEYPDLEGAANPYAIDNAMVETGTSNPNSRHGLRGSNLE